VLALLIDSRTLTTAAAAAAAMCDMNAQLEYVNKMAKKMPLYIGFNYNIPRCLLVTMYSIELDAGAGARESHASCLVRALRSTPAKDI
jgi:hypothetical protein